MELINRTEQSAVTVIGFNTGSLDASNADAFRKQIRPALESAKAVAIDMSSLEFVDSSGLGALLSCLRFCTEKGGNFAVFGLQRPVAALFELMRMHRVFSVFNNLDEIKEALS
ncbi:STAS domain-containing protein [Chitinilyticum piscinae]|uniref:Anti-sigma factor antagonist n=1 Tax=Chitinilyticum piscinae TaxID=2866724 RepID=A0A8J7K253_9NEIS|nr:STAS domain-containing protein [Chitinilyticum piscinae]MBE9609547.1 STAS domain-containing protein [Chitinilyticum piscinae]